MAGKSPGAKNPRPDRAVRPNELEAALRITHAVLAAEAQPYALIGGLAIAARATPRFTHDVDFALACHDAEAEALVASFVRRGFAVDSLLVSKTTQAIATVRLIPPGSTVLVDLLFDFTGIERAIVQRASRAQVIRGLTMAIASRAHLIAMKVLANREKDRVDLGSLLDVASKRDVARARSALTAMQRAGKAHDRDLRAELDDFLAARQSRAGEFVKVPKRAWPKGWGTRPGAKRH